MLCWEDADFSVFFFLANKCWCSTSILSWSSPGTKKKIFLFQQLCRLWYRTLLTGYIAVACFTESFDTSWNVLLIKSMLIIVSHDDYDTVRIVFLLKTNVLQKAFCKSWLTYCWLISNLDIISLTVCIITMGAVGSAAFTTAAKPSPSYLWYSIVFYLCFRCYMLSGTLFFYSASWLTLPSHK